MGKKPYTVIGTDWNGDLQAFHSDDPERALAMFEQFREDLDEITLSEPLERYMATQPA